MSSEEHSDNKLRIQNKLDEALQRELDEALGGQSIEELVEAEQAAKPAAGQAGPTRRGTVIAIQGDDIFVDMGGKSQGLLPAEQFEEEPLPAVGDSVEVTIEGYDGREGLLLLSRKGAVMAAAGETLEEGQIVGGRVTGFNKGGLELTINGIRAFMPISQVELFRVEDLAPYVNQRFKCKVSEVDRAAQNVILSRRDVLQQEAFETREELFNSLVEGKMVVGTVRSIMPYGAFVNLGPGVDGLLHVKDMRYGRVEDPRTVVSEGQKIEAMVLKVDREARKISLGLKQVMPDPWIDVDKKFLVESIVSGRVTRLADFGAFVELEAGVEGLVPISEMTFERRINHPKEIVQEGAVIKVKVLSIDPERKRISLSIKRVGDDPWMGASARWKEGTIVTGVVRRVSEFGAFVELTAGVEGLVHISELSHEHVRAVSDAVKENQVVQAKVLEVDEERRRISLSIKQLATVADYTGPSSSSGAAGASDQPPDSAKKRKKPLKGGLD